MNKFFLTAFLLIVYSMVFSQSKTDSLLLPELKENMLEYFQAKDPDQKKKYAKKIIKQRVGF